MVHKYNFRCQLIMFLDVNKLLSEFDLGDTDTVEHRITTTDDEPVMQTFRRIPSNQYEQVKQHISNLLKHGIVTESHSPFAAPIVLAKKKDGSHRMCVDYHRLNSKTKKDAFPLPRISEFIDAPVLFLS